MYLISNCGTVRKAELQDECERKRRRKTQSAGFVYALVAAMFQPRPSASLQQQMNGVKTQSGQ